MAAILVRDGTQRTYTVVESAVTLGPSDFDGASPDDHQRYLPGLVAGIDQYLRDAGAAPVRDGVVYQQVPIWATPDDPRELAAAVTELLQPLRTAKGKRRRATFAMVVHPS